jgi:hypothetical protein
LYDGDQAVTTYYRGNLSVSAPSNDAPGDTGPDWADIATITPVQDPNSTELRRPMVTKAMPGRPMHITVYVPTPAQRKK